MTQQVDGASPDGDRAVVNGDASVSALRASVPSALTLDEVFANLDAHAEAEEDFATDWILLAVDRHGEAFVLDADEGFWSVDLLTELWACDNQIDYPSGLEAGLYLMTDIVIAPDFDGDPTFKGRFQSLATKAQAIEARRAETLGSACESAVPEGNAP
jgi:hypothetical protein